MIGCDASGEAVADTVSTTLRTTTIAPVVGSTASPPLNVSRYCSAIGCDASLVSVVRSSGVITGCSAVSVAGTSIPACNNNGVSWVIVNVFGNGTDCDSSAMYAGLIGVGFDDAANATRCSPSTSSFGSTGSGRRGVGRRGLVLVDQVLAVRIGVEGEVQPERW